MGDQISSSASTQGPAMLIHSGSTDGGGGRGGGRVCRRVWGGGGGVVEVGERRNKTSHR